MIYTDVHFDAAEDLTRAIEDWASSLGTPRSKRALEQVRRHADNCRSMVLLTGKISRIDNIVDFIDEETRFNTVSSVRLYSAILRTVANDVEPNPYAVNYGIE